MTDPAPSPAIAGTTSTRVLRAGSAKGQGSDAAYLGLAYGPGEPLLRRLDLAPDAPMAAHRTPLLSFVQITDIHVQDTQSPGRFEFVNRFAGPAPMHLLAPAYRPQEFLQTYVCEAMIRSINGLGPSDLTGAEIDFIMCTGDLTDNGQINELRWALALLDGSRVGPVSSGETYEGVASVAWDDAAYWHPDRYQDEYKKRWGFPTYPGLLHAAFTGFKASGISRPWLTCFGNHDALVQGTAVFTPEYKRIVTGGEKPALLPAGFDILGHMNEYIGAPELFLAGPRRPVSANRERRNFSRDEFLRLHHAASGTPHGHGTNAQNLEERRTYYVDDSHPGLRLIVLDTVNGSGHYQGSIGAAQQAWLEDRLAEVHSCYFDPEDRATRTGATDRLVVIVSHHNLDSLVNDLAVEGYEADFPRILSPEIEMMLHRYPNVILWVNGHTHFNTVTPRPDPAGKTSGFWEVTTSSLLDWPCQARHLEIVANGNGTISILSTMIDHAAPADSCEAEGIFGLAAIHRELAANDPHCGIASGQQGTPADRNVELIVPAPFPVE